VVENKVKGMAGKNGESGEQRGKCAKRGSRACANSSHTQIAQYLLCVNTIYRVLHSNWYEEGWRDVRLRHLSGKGEGRDASGKAGRDGVGCRDGERKAESVRKVQGDWHSRDWEGKSGHPTLAPGDARWRGCEETQDAEAQASKVN
jgi:hypothetical protein